MAHRKMGFQWRSGTVMNFIKSLAFVIGLGISASAAQQSDWCTYYDANGVSAYMPVGECRFMGSKEDLDTWGREVCGSRTVALVPDWNDRITAVKLSASTARTVTLYLNVMKDENVLTQVVNGGTTWSIPTDSPFYSQASVALCE